MNNKAERVKVKIYTIGCHENNGNKCHLGDDCWAQAGDDVTKDISEARKLSKGWSDNPYVLEGHSNWVVVWYANNPNWGRLRVLDGSGRTKIKMLPEQVVE